MIDRLYPSLAELQQLKRPIHPETLELALFLNNHLPDSWEIYIEPFMNNEKPDIVLLEKETGVIFIKCTDLDAENLEARVNINHSDQGKTIVRNILKREGGQIKKLYNPATDSHHLADRLSYYYVPEIGEAIENKEITEGIVKKAIYAPKMTQADAYRIFGDEAHQFIITREILSKDRLEQLLYKFEKSEKTKLREEWYEKIKFWFVPPFHKKEHGMYIKLNPQQARYATSQPGKFQRLRGVAGSGKSLIIARRAANIAAKRNNVLILTYNVTLINYLLEHVKRAYEDFDIRYIEIENYHYFCMKMFRQCQTAAPSGVSADKRLNEEYPKKMMELIQTGRIKQRYDAILIDEVQDFMPQWVDSIMMLLEEKYGEVLIVADDNQDIYGKGTKNLEQMKKGFSGPWGELKECYRLHEKIVIELNRFIEKYLDNCKIINKKEKDDLYTAKIYWENLHKHTNLNETIKAIIDYLERGVYIHKEDMVILLPEHAMGRGIAKYLNEYNIETIEAFGDRKKKTLFKYDDWRLKLCTLQSFKGWEYDTIITVIPGRDYKHTSSISKLVYTSMSRARRNLVVLNLNEEYNSFPDYKEWQRIPGLA